MQFFLCFASEPQTKWVRLLRIRKSSFNLQTKHTNRCTNQTRNRNCTFFFFWFNAFSLRLARFKHFFVWLGHSIFWNFSYVLRCTVSLAAIEKNRRQRFTAWIWILRERRFSCANIQKCEHATFVVLNLFFFLCACVYQICVPFFAIAHSAHNACLVRVN